MFRNPRENALRPPSKHIRPSIGRPPSPMRGFTQSQLDPSSASAPKSAPLSSPRTTHMPTVQPKPTPLQVRPPPKSNPMFKPRDHSKSKVRQNGNILSFFKKAEEKATALFVPGASRDVDQSAVPSFEDTPIPIERYNECNGSVKRRKTGTEGSTEPSISASQSTAAESASDRNVEGEHKNTPSKRNGSLGYHRSRRGPFALDSDSEDDGYEEGGSIGERAEGLMGQNIDQAVPPPGNSCDDESQRAFKNLHRDTVNEKYRKDHVGEIEAELNDDDWFDGVPPEGIQEEWSDIEPKELNEEGDEASVFPENLACPICACSLERSSPEQASIHVNSCLDRPSAGEPNEPKPESDSKDIPSPRIVRPPKPAQRSPFTPGLLGPKDSSAFTKIMSSHAENTAWKNAAVAESASKGRPSYQRTCPFYKIIPGFSICVDAFRYGAVQGCEAYFLSHFHSDHYIGLTASWNHGPIYCSKVTGNLVRQQLKVNPKYIIDLEFEKRASVPNTNGVSVTMIPANHCPGSSLFLFEKVSTKASRSRTQRILHCGDFRASREQLEHPLLRSDVLDPVSGSVRQQKIDVCYLDTTYLNPRYAFPDQSEVISVCAEMCASLSKEKKDLRDGWEQVKRGKADKRMEAFIQRNPQEPGHKPLPRDESRGKLLVVVGTYSIGKERLCVGIARALGSKIFAPAAKRRICGCLEDPELSSLLTKDPKDAQVHMVPMFEIRSDTLAEYMASHAGTFTRAVAFRPTGWTYRPPGFRSTDSPTVPNVLFGDTWKTSFSLKDLVAQRGSTENVGCFGVPYSEHSSFRELTIFCCALNIDRIIPTVNVGDPKSRERMKAWLDKCAAFSQRNPDSFLRIAECMSRGGNGNV
ncbi:DRMBL-domain-containing protein [Eremomyces bilateralis CBS 781.70]|uniref:DRMBL-domain-containing protein n=1 Tax=Eremomyces bilateralis CBS 781.70 TaxID=1392243 RepID=A0A6G1FQJ5_9PEZI|nr:DRMBL-domain-containing protein [Eremomyces bilateralis CBS 781.70]KAF1808067.1 DRMBL-domain-containing protein [Eremomyces bilateralis CBS 781.70]